MDVVMVLLFTALGCGAAALLWGQLWFSVRKRKILQRYQLQQTETFCQARITSQAVRRLTINCIPIRTRHDLSFVYKVSSSGGAQQQGTIVSKKHSRIYNGCASVSPFPGIFAVRMIQGYPQSGYPERWVRDGDSYFRPGILALLVCLYGMTVGPGLVGQYWAGTINENAPLPFGHIIPVGFVFLVIGFLIAKLKFEEWKTNVLGEQEKEEGICGEGGTSPSYTDVPTTEEGMESPV